MPHEHEFTPVQSPPREVRKTMDKSEVSASASDAHSQTGSLYTLPLDVLFEILTHLNLTSLFRLSQTSHALRDTLLSPAATCIWLKSPRHSAVKILTGANVIIPQNARHNALEEALPPPTRDLSIREFLSLLFDDVCDFCHAALGREDRIVRIWAARLRCCERCLDDSAHIVPEKNMPREFQMVRDVQGYFGNDYALSNLFPASVGDLFGPSRPYPRVAVERLIAEFERDNYGKGEEDRKAWIVRKAAEHEDVVEHAQTCVLWDMARQRRKEAWLRAKRKERVQQIKSRLPELDALPASVSEILTNLAETPTRQREYHIERFEIPAGVQALVRKPEALSEADWIKIRAGVLELAKAVRRREVLCERYASLARACEQFAEDEENKGCILPGLGDLATWKEVTNVVEGTPIEEDVSEEDLRALVDDLARAGRFSGWRATCEDALVAMLNAADPSRARPATTADLALATTVFSLTWVSSCVWYPKILEWTPTRPSTGREDAQRIVVKRAWAANEFRVDVRHSGLAARVVSMAGLDPATATVEDMDRLDVWFSQTEDVVGGDLERQMMRWRDAVRSLSPSPSEEDDGGLFLLSDEEVKEGHIRQQLARLLELEGHEGFHFRFNRLSP
ncbi:uncharacterized protein SCHCODRAFT_02481773 [Schizophyllum commune H4-8]|nr:uncharacterized protein SCHCODRAFT_02481773 [Schizophyllum commune H4-8]KAI5900847.1 hypothetical protein SCHCODRAFT_02481773 [Schizophyllum commune H4-8]